MYRRIVLALLTALLGVAVSTTPARADPPTCEDTGDCVPLNLGKQYHLKFMHTVELPPESPPVVVKEVGAGLATLANPDPQMPWQEAVLFHFRAAAAALGPAGLVLIGVAAEPSAPETAVALVCEAGAAVAAGLKVLGYGLADPDHAAYYDALALEEFAVARQALAAAVQSGG